MFRKILAFVCILNVLFFCVQKVEAVTSLKADSSDNNIPKIYYSAPRECKIADITVTGVDNYESSVLVGLSGLSVGQVVKIPGDDITDALKRYWKNGLFSDVKILATKIEGNQVWLEIKLSPRPRISAIKYNGIKKSDKEELEPDLGLVVGNQITPNIADRARTMIKKHYDKKGFTNASVDIIQKEDPADKNQIIVEINVDRKDKIKVHQLIIDGNEALSDFQISRAMTKTNQKGKLENLFRTKKFVQAEYEKDKVAVIEKYNEYGYRDAVIVEDTVYRFNDKSVNVYLKISEGQKYYHRNINWVGNTVYSAEQLNRVLQIQRGDVYNQKRLDERLTNSKDEDAVSNLYMDNGYLFYNIDPVEVKVDGDSIDLELRIVEGKQATINRVNINGNDRVYEEVVRRELRVKPGALFSKAEIIRSAREIQQMGFFDPENINPVPVPDREAGTVDIDMNLTPKNNDQIQFSAGWGSTGIVGSVSLKFTNFSIKNLLNIGTYKVLPQGDGETFSITGSTNGKYYSSYSFSFLEPWLGGKRPNSLQVSGFYSHQTDVSSRYTNSSSNYYNSLYSSYSSAYSNSYLSELDPNKYLKMWGLTVALGGRLTWPDDYFQLTGELSYQHYSLQNWSYFVINNGKCNDLSVGATLARKSVDSPLLYPRSGSDFSLSVQATPPYSAFDKYNDADYAKMTTEELYKWVEYYKIKFKSKTYTPVTSDKKLILMTRFDMGYIGYYDKYKLSPFGAFYMGGDGTTGYSSTYTYETVAFRGYENGALGTSNIYERLCLELHYPLMMQASTTIYGLTFLEAGNLWSAAKVWNPFELKRSAGVGVRIYLPMVGLMGIDWAYGFDKATSSSTSRSGGRFHFIIGQEF
jgi:outer membrane protein insertion porin family